MTRRSFLKLAALAATARIVIPAFIRPRLPYVRVGEVVSYIGLAKYPAPGFIGATIVAEVGEWDGVGYPCLLTSQSYGSRHPYMPERFYDSDLADLNREVPERFWWSDANRRRYKNVHEYVREQRYGDIPSGLLRAAGLPDWGRVA